MSHKIIGMKNENADRDKVMMFMGYSVGQIITPHFFLASESPRYPTSFRAVYVSVSLMIAIEIALM
jgi:ACS family allantoate permease-like MFS transporter